ncbi:MAG TPA: YezD family protein [Verrucomicrobiae bacterium]
MNRTAEIEGAEPAWLAVLKHQVESLRFGTVQVVVHEARVVQIEKTEKVRFDKGDLEQALKTAAA